MKRILAGLTLVVLVVALLAAPSPASAGPRYYQHRGGHGGGGGYLVGGLALGALTGVIVGGILASRPTVVYEPAPVYVPPAPAPVYVQPAPVYVAPQPVCADYWVPDGYRGGGVWVQGHWERACR